LDGGKPFRKMFGTMKTFASSAGVTRGFCGTCGANAYWMSEERPELLDVSVGLLEAGSGVRGEEWLWWAFGRVSFGEAALNRELVDGLDAGLKMWGEKT